MISNILFAILGLLYFVQVLCTTYSLIPAIGHFYILVSVVLMWVAFFMIASMMCDELFKKEEL